MLRTAVLVIGGGPAGALAARFLAREGIDTILLERDLTYVKPCGGGIPSTAFDEFSLPTCLAARRIDTVKLVSPRGESVPVKLKGASIVIVDRGDFDASLRNDAQGAGARVIEAEFRRFLDIGKTIILEAALEGDCARIESDYVIAADGVNSRVRSALGMKPVDSLFTISEKIREEVTDCCEFWLSSSHAPRLYSWVFPQKEGVSVGTGSLNSRETKAMWQKFVERRGITTGPSMNRINGPSLRGYRIPLWQGDLYTRGRVLFVGDTAGQVLPLTYEGIYYAMKSGELAAMAIAEGKIGDYQRLWKKSFSKRFILMRRLWEYFLKDDHHAEKLVQFHKRPEVQEASMRLWLRKDSGKGSLLSYMKIFKELFR